MNRRGFTLLEVLVATVILAIAITGLLSALSTSMRSAGRVTDADRAAVLARRKMDELLVQPQLPRMTTIEGAWEESTGIQGGWRAQVTPFEQPPQSGVGSAVLDRVQLEVWWMNGDQRRSFQVDGYRTTVIAPPAGEQEAQQ